MPASFVPFRSPRPRADFASERARRLLEHNSLARLEQVFLQAQSAPPRHAGRAVWETELLDERGDRVRVFAKLNWGRHRLLPRMSDLRTGQVLQPMPRREWNGLGQLAGIGICVAERLAVFESGWWRFRAAVLVRAVPAPYSIAELLTWGVWRNLARDERDAMLLSAAATLRRIHSAGLGWRGTCMRHLFPERLPGGALRMWVIDCEGVQPGGGRRVVARDLGKLCRSMELCGADPASVERLREHYRAARLQSAADGHCDRFPVEPALTSA